MASPCDHPPICPAECTQYVKHLQYCPNRTTDLETEVIAVWPSTRSLEAYALLQRREDQNGVPCTRRSKYVEHDPARSYIVRLTLVPPVQAKMLKSYKRLTLAIHQFDNDSLPPASVAIGREDEMLVLQKWSEACRYKFSLIDRVIVGRKLHHDQFYAGGDSSHSHFVDSLCVPSLLRQPTAREALHTPACIGYYGWTNTIVLLV